MCYLGKVKAACFITGSMLGHYSRQAMYAHVSHLIHLLPSLENVSLMEKIAVLRDLNYPFFYAMGIASTSGNYIVL
jgi:hypothetical protein